MKTLPTLLLSLVLVSCASKTTPPPQAKRLGQDGPVISRIVSRNGVIVVRAGPHGPTYSTESKDGIILTEQMTLPELALKNPEMFRTIKTLEADASWADTLR